jgi:hypothetical protein
MSGFNSIFAMRTYRYIIHSLLLSIVIISCEKDNEIDTEKPVIDLSIQDAFPANCDTIYFGESFTFKVLFSDNAELGTTTAFSIKVHHNFDHHAHSTEVTECNLDPKREKDEWGNPFTFINAYDIPEGSKKYETNLSILIPSGDNKGDFEEGDHHFFISLTDKEGWSTQKGLSIKMLHR